MPFINYTFVNPIPIANATGNNCGVGPALGVAPMNNLPGLGGINNRVFYAWPALVNAAVTVGAGVPPPPPAMPLYEIAWRRSCLRAGAFTNGNFLRGSAIMRRLERTERSTVVYHIGSILAGFIANAAGFINVGHLSRFTQAFPGAIAFMGALRPDFILMNGGNFQIWEAKGRVGAAIPGVLNGAMGQANSVVNVTTPAAFAGMAGAPAFPPGPFAPAPVLAPNGRIASVANLILPPGGNNCWHVHVTDPSSKGPAMMPPKFQNEYYRKFYAYFQELLYHPMATQKRQIKYDQKSFETSWLPIADIRFGIDKRILDILRKPKLASGGLAKSIENVLHNGFNNPKIKTNRAFVNNNGIYVEINSP